MVRRIERSLNESVPSSVLSAEGRKTGKSFSVLSGPRWDAQISSSGGGMFNDRRSILRVHADRNLRIANRKHALYPLSTAIRVHVKWKSTISL